MPFRLLLAFALILLTIRAPLALAVVAFDNFGPQFGRSTSTGVIAAGTNGEFGKQISGIQFAPQTSGLFMQFFIAASAMDSGRPNDGLRFTLTEDNGDTPGSALESVVLNDVCYVDFDCPEGQLYMLSASSSRLLSAAVSYWLLASSDLPDGTFIWYLTSEIAPALVYLQDGFTGVFEFSSPPALRVDVTPVVTEVFEPATPVLLATLALLIAISIRWFVKGTPRGSFA